ncbi:AbrB/MazE/SpoVT family DNA-binding domain-containing protein [Chryseobacterium sp. PS-8]|uniref:AbrB/MazE/SpoVT family DNA-binding domain-containing protein n=1 Tax=Chryseobacterium indicum TaxID=2766954 RepID=A0ABS9C8Z8_9FLAO|nr:AbrB/MazE/SpoVT family DNA-binding domain-containing protein [Chryseobacterium sp. PS-8]MCF2221046.1 AbrB/MazE/SpoVT family DNA-binding domain-containing protein [Chryseobacterium sp. PS-8]
MLHSLKMFNTGQITLPKAWRSKYNTQNFIARETSEGLLITPLVAKETTSGYYENGEESGIYFPD